MDFLPQDNAGHSARHCHRHLGMRSTTGQYLLFVFLNRAPEWIFLRVGLDKLPCIGREQNYWENQIQQVEINDYKQY